MGAAVTLEEKTRMLEILKRESRCRSNKESTPQQPRKTLRAVSLSGVLEVSILFAATLIIAILLLCTALLLTLAELFGSIITALLIVGGVALILSIILYFALLRPRIDSFHHEMREIEEIANRAIYIYRCIKNLLASLL